MKRKSPGLKPTSRLRRFSSRPVEPRFLQFEPTRFEFEKKADQINMRVPKPLLEAVKPRAKARAIPYTRFIRETLERAMTRPK